MAQFQASLPNVEVTGEGVLSVVDGMGVFKNRALKILSENGISQPTKGQWYPQQAFLDSFRIIAETIGSKTLHAIGRKVPENAHFPDDINDIESALQSIDVAYHMNQRLNGVPMYDPSTGKMLEGIGHYHYQKLGENKIKMKCDTPYPCDFDHGLIEAMARKFKPPGCLFVEVRHDDTTKCRTKGDESCTYYVEW